MAQRHYQSALVVKGRVVHSIKYGRLDTAVRGIMRQQHELSAHRVQLTETSVAVVSEKGPIIGYVYTVEGA